MKILVTGGSGFLGGYVVDELLRSGHDVFVGDITSPAWRPDLNFIELDVTKYPGLEKKVKDFDCVYHFAGLADINESIQYPRKAIDSNIIGTFNLLEACVKAKISRFIFASSAYVLSTKGGMYGVSKRSAELMIEEYQRSFGLNYTIIRYGSVYGERADHKNRIYRILKQALEERQIDFQGDGSEVREYIHAADAARLSVNILSDEYINSHLILTGVERFSYSELLDLINETLGGKIKINLKQVDYHGHYKMTPYSFSPTAGKKLIANPFIDFGQGILNCIEEINHCIHEKG